MQGLSSSRPWARLVSLCMKFPRRLFWVMKIWQIHNLPFKNMFTLHLKFFRSFVSKYTRWKKIGKKQCLYKAPMGFEPMTSCLLDRRSNQLSYGASRFTVCALVESITTSLVDLKISKKKSVVFWKFLAWNKRTYRFQRSNLQRLLQRFLFSTHNSPSSY